MKKAVAVVLAAGLFLVQGAGVSMASEAGSSFAQELMLADDGMLLSDDLIIEDETGIPGSLPGEIPGEESGKTDEDGPVLDIGGIEIVGGGSGNAGGPEEESETETESETEDESETETEMESDEERQPEVPSETDADNGSTADTESSLVTESEELPEVTEAPETEQQPVVEVQTDPAPETEAAVQTEAAIQEEDAAPAEDSVVAVEEVVTPVPGRPSSDPADVDAAIVAEEMETESETGMEEELLVVSETYEEVADPGLTANAYKVVGNNITMTVNNGADIAQDLNSALKEAAEIGEKTGKQVTVTVPAGSYMLSAGLHIYSNTTLSMKGVTLTHTGQESFNMLVTGTRGAYKGQENYNQSEVCSGYNGFKNIKVIGGKWVSKQVNKATVIRMFHATNVTLDGITITGGGCTHQMEIAAINGFYLRNSTFRDFGKSENDVNNIEKQEAVQLDMPIAERTFTSVYQDGTPMKNVEVTGCTFQNVARGIGTHTMLLGAYHENIKISNNTFSNVLEECIVALNYYNCEISGNTMTNCGAGILYENFKGRTGSINTSTFEGKKAYNGTYRYDVKTVISGNTMKIRYTPTCQQVTGIKVAGYNLPEASKGGDKRLIPAGNYYVSGVTVSNNTITTAGAGIHMMDATNCTVSGNVIKGSGFSSKDPRKNDWDGIMVEQYGKKTVVSGNQISGMPRNGIMVQRGVTDLKISKNKISGSKRGGIVIQQNGAAASITSNSISKCAGRGISLYDKSKCTGAISGNKISSCKDGGIVVSTNSSSGAVKGNTIASVSGDAAISIYDNAKASSITGNTIKNLGKDGKGKVCTGIRLMTKAVSGKISGNKMLTTGKAKYAVGKGIMVYDRSTVKGSVEKNEISKSSEAAVSISTKSTVTGSISSNKIKSSADNGIELVNSAVVSKDIRGNAVSAAGDRGISVAAKSTVKGSIAANSVSKSKGVGIYLASLKNKMTVSGNKVLDGKDHGIVVYTGTTAYPVSITKNTLRGNGKAQGIRGISGSVSIKGNTISKMDVGISLDGSVKGTIYVNTFEKGVKIPVKAGGKKYTPKTLKGMNQKLSGTKLSVKWN